MKAFGSPLSRGVGGSFSGEED